MFLNQRFYASRYFSDNDELFDPVGFLTLEMELKLQNENVSYYVFYR